MAMVIILHINKLVPFRGVMYCFGKCDNFDLHIFDWVIAGIHHIPVVMTVLVPIEGV